MATAKPSRSGRPRTRATAAKPQRQTQAQKDKAQARQRERLSRLQSTEATARASQRRVESMAQTILKKQLQADEKALAQALADQRYKEMSGAGEGVGSPEQRAAALPQQRKAQQRQQARQTVQTKPAKPAAKGKGGKAA